MAKTTILLRSILPGFLLLLHHGAVAQDYIAYQRAFNRVDDLVCQQHLAAALPVLDSVAAGYTFIYARHCVKALQIAVSMQDTNRAVYWLSRSITQGVPLWVIHSNTLMAASLGYPAAQQVVLHYDSLHRIYKSRINEPLSRKLDSMMEIDAWYTRRVNDGFVVLRHTLFGIQWIRNNNRLHRELKRIIASYGYPAERLVGVGNLEDSTTEAAAWVKKNGPGLGMQDRRVFFMLLHYTSTRRADITGMLYPFVSSGYLQVDQYARVNDYLVIAGGKRVHRLTQYYVHHNNKSESPDVVNARRDAIGLNTYEAQKRNQQLKLEQWKSGTVNSSILLE